MLDTFGHRSIVGSWLPSNDQSDHLLWHDSSAASRAHGAAVPIPFIPDEIWYQRDHKTGAVGEEFQNVVVLSDEFFAEVMAHPIPAASVKVFGAAPGLLDLFLWLTYRCTRSETDFAIWRVWLTGLGESIQPAATVSRDIGAMAAADPGGVARCQLSGNGRTCGSRQHARTAGEVESQEDEPRELATSGTV